MFFRNKIFLNIIKFIVMVSVLPTYLYSFKKLLKKFMFNDFTILLFF